MTKAEILARLKEGPAHNSLETGVAIVDETLWLPAVKGGVYFEGAVETARMVDPYSIQLEVTGPVSMPSTGLVVVEDAQGPLTRVCNTLHGYEATDFIQGETFYSCEVTGLVIDIKGMKQVQTTGSITTGTYMLTEGNGKTVITTLAPSGVLTYFSSIPNLLINEMVYYSYGSPIKLNYLVPSVEITTPDLRVLTFTEGGLMTNGTIDLKDTGGSPGWYKLAYYVPRSYCLADTISVYPNGTYTFYQELGDWQIGGSNLAPYEVGDTPRFIVHGDAQVPCTIQLLYDERSLRKDANRTYPGMITLRALDSIGNPVADVNLTAQISGATVIAAPAHQEQLTDADGRMSFAVIPGESFNWDITQLSGTYVYHELTGTFTKGIVTTSRSIFDPADLARPPRALYSVDRMAQQAIITPILNTGPLMLGNYSTDINGQLTPIYKVYYTLSIRGGILIDVTKNRAAGNEHIYSDPASIVLSYEDGTFTVAYKRTGLVCELTCKGELKDLGENTVYSYEETIVL